MKKGPERYRDSGCEFRYIQFKYSSKNISIFQIYFGLWMVPGIFWNTRKWVLKNPRNILDELEISEASILSLPRLFFIICFYGVSVSSRGLLVLACQFDFALRISESQKPPKTQILIPNSENRKCQYFVVP